MLAISPQHRCRIARLVNFHKYHHGSFAIHTKQRPVIHCRVRGACCAHSLSYPVSSSQTDYLKFCFFPNTIMDSNDFAEDVASAPTFELF